LADHLESCNTFSLKKIRYLVLDEADRMLDGGFDHQLSVIFQVTRQKTGANPSTPSYNASAVKIYNATSSLLHFEKNLL
jgi:superfamily II DNA/RNA helicase